MPVYCMSGSVFLLVRLPKNFLVYPVYPERVFGVYAVYPKDCGSRNGHKAPKFVGAEIIPTRNPPPPPL